MVKVLPASPGKPTEASLALVCEESDLEGVRQLTKEIKATHSVEAQFPDFLGGRLKAMDRLRKWRDYLSHSEVLLFYYGAAERGRLELIWQKAQEQTPKARRSWFIAPPDLEDKRKQYPDALWSIDQVTDLLEMARRAQG